MFQRIHVSADARVRVFYMALCPFCGPPLLPVPFGSEQERNTWVQAHENETKHQVRRHTEILIDTDEKSPLIDESP